jgi:Zn-dependent peptidase ImmA (M78 family)
MTSTATAMAGPSGQTPSDELSARMSMLGLRTPAARADLKSGLLGRLRVVCPHRSLTWAEAERIADRQADLLRQELGLGSRPAIPTSGLLDLPFLTVTHHDQFPTSGMATKTGLGWVIVIRGDEPTVRQRFSLAHEIKHIVDDEMMIKLDGSLYPATPLYTAAERGERVADRFAASLLMPRVLIRRDWGDGLQDPAVLARRYDVSRPAIEVRLRQLGLLQATPRCATAARTERSGGQRG